MPMKFANTPRIKHDPINMMMIQKFSAIGGQWYLVRTRWTRIWEAEVVERVEGILAVAVGGVDF